MSQSEKFKAWLEKIQQESWQLELIISGFALFGIKEGLSVVRKLELISNFEVGSLSFFYMTLLGSARIVLIILFINLLIHVILRSLWIGAIGLRYVSGDIDFERLNYSKKFDSFLKSKSGSFDNYISKLEDWCSVLFAYAFLLTFILVSFFIFLFWALLPVLLNAGQGPVGQIFLQLFIIIYLFFGLIYFLDLLLLGIFKKIKRRVISNLFFIIYRVFDLITLSFLYRPLLLNFLDSTFTRKLFYFSLPFLFIILIFPSFQVFDFRHTENFPKASFLHSQYYDDLRIQNEENAVFGLERRQKIFWFSLDKHIITKDYSKIFFALRSSDSDYIEEKYNLKSDIKSGLRFKHLNKRNDSTSSSDTDIITAETKILLDLIDFKIDNINYVDSLSCKLYIHQNLNEQGMLCLFPTRSLSNGEHLVKIKKRTIGNSFIDSIRSKSYELPIWIYKE